MNNSINNIIDVYMSLSEQLNKTKKPFVIVVVIGSSVKSICVGENDFLDLICCSNSVAFDLNNERIFSARAKSDFFINSDMYKIIFDK